MTAEQHPAPHRPLVALEATQAFILSASRVLPAVRLPTEEAAGLVLAEGAVAEVAVPGFDNSAMDGFALRSVDCGPGHHQLVVVDEVMAGRAATRRLFRGEAARIMTGAPLPEGADTVCPLEECSSHDGRVVLDGPRQPGTHIRRAGEDTETGQLVAPAGTWVGPALVGQLRAVGCFEVSVHRRAKVGVLSTGDELVGGATVPGGINDSNRAMLCALLRAEGFEPLDLGVVADDPVAVRQALFEAVARCDVVVSTGGVSVGDRDVVRDVLAEAPTTVARWFQVAIKPAKPLAFAVVSSPSETAVFGLPGNPVSALVSCELFAVPFLRRMAGHRGERPLVQAMALEDFRRRPDHKVHLVASVVALEPDGRLAVRPTGPQGSHRLSSASRANALAVVPEGSGVAAGESLSVLLLPALGPIEGPGRRGPRGALVEMGASC